ncbi:hypothetical protein FACS189485_22270 [Spirochaetia bacterium]|nr:hypothetical protein FACS189485_22270 [Spirochaetia bacterium]
MQAYHKGYGLGTIIAQDGDTIVVEFQNGNLQRCPRNKLELKETPSEMALNKQYGDFDKCLVVCKS